MYKRQIAAFVPRCEQERRDKNIIFHHMNENPHNILTRDNALAHITSSGFIMNRDLTKALVIFHKVYQAWGWTGGHADGEGDLLEVALKEAKEETGLEKIEPLTTNILSLDILPVWGHTKKGRYVSAHLHLNASYVLIADEEANLTLNEEETEGVMWIDADRIGEYSTEPDLVEVYRKLIDRARVYDPSRQRKVQALQMPEESQDFGSVMARTSIPIAVHEAKSAYYKAMLVKEITVHSGKGIAGIIGKAFRPKGRK